MGVHGLWKLLEPAGKAVALETLQNKILGVDVSIWLHQVMKGFQDKSGSPLPNAHLLGLFHRVCKLLFYRIKPVFVFDGGVPILKKNTIANRKKQKGKAARDAERIREQLLKNLVKHKAVRKVLGEKAGRNVVSEERSQNDENLFELPPMLLNDLDVTEIDSSDSDASVKYEPSVQESDSDQDVKYLSPSKVYAMNLDLHSLDVKSENFRSLPADVRHDILSDLKETRKQSSWGRLHEMPKESTDFSSYQLDRLLKRRSVQVSLEEAEKEMGGKVLSMAELQDIMNAQGVKLEEDSTAKDTQLNAFSRRIASDVATRFLLVSAETSKQKEPTTPEKDEAKTEDVKKELQETKVKVKQEYQDTWSSDDEVEMIGKQEITEVKIKQEIPDRPSHDQPDMLCEQNLAEQYLTDKDSLSQEEILALIQNEKLNAARKSRDSTDIPSTSREAIVSSGTSAPANRSPVVAKSDSDNDFDEVPPVQSESLSSIKKVSPHKPRTEQINRKSQKSIEVVVDKSEGYKPEDDIFADLFPGHKSVTETSLEQKRKEIGENNEAELQKMPGASAKSLERRKEDNVKLGPKSINVVVDKSQNYEPGDDIFADVFSEHKPKETVTAGHDTAGVMEVVIDRSKNYKPEDDIFADIFPEQETEKEINELLLQETKVQDKNVNTFLSEKETPTRDAMESDVENRSLEATKKSSEDKIVKRAESEIKVGDKDIGSSAASAPADLLGSGKEEASMPAAVDDSLGEADETARQKSDKELAVSSMSSEELQSLETALEERHDRLMAERGRQERLAASITDQMCAEAQELLRLFGVPYVVAPMEAEAQCAFLDALSLTEGTITDDSDIWLFGGRKVYKNFFNQKKHVLQYTSATIQHYLKLERHHMVLLALLVGSDYTTGLEGVGPVTAMEVLAAFPPGKADNLAGNRDGLLEGLRRFRDWWQAGRPQRSARTQQLRNKIKDVHFYEGFPSLAVVDAYLRPAVDESREVFSWGDFDLQGLREFARMKFGWAQAKADEILVPVAKRVAERKSQRFIDSYFNVMPHFKEGEQKMSKRVKRAVLRMDDDGDDDVDDPESLSSPPEKQKATRKRAAPKGAASRQKQRADEENSPVRQPKERRPSSVPNNDEADNGDAETQRTPPRARKTRRKAVSQAGKAGGEELHSVGPSERKPAPRQRKSSAPRRTAVKRTKDDEDQNPDECSAAEDDALLLTKESKTVSDDESCPGSSKQVDEGPKPRPRQRTHTGVVRTGVKGAPKNRECEVDSELSRSTDDPSLTPDDQKEVNKSDHSVKTGKTDSERESTGIKRNLNAGRQSSFESIPEEQEEENASSSVQPTSMEFEPKPGTSSDYKENPAGHDEEPEEDEEAILAALHAMDWDDDPWGGFEPPRERVFYGGVRKNPAPRTRRPTQPVPPPPPQPIDIRGYRPGTRTLERIESRVAHPQFELNSPDSNIPQREKNRLQAEESKMRAIKLFKAAGAMKKNKLLGEDPSAAKRRTKRKKVTTKVTESLNLSEESSDD